ncbi:MAG: galactose mutarotase [Clostridia bacterium]|nr:galactose mutarotase [Clostridia bacterium]
MKVTSEPFGTTKNGQKVERFWLTDDKCQVGILTLGGTIQSLYVPDLDGNMTDVVLGFDSVQAYENQTCYIGALLGRCANRIAGNEVMIGQKKIPLRCNDNGVCHLHGGITGFDKKLWKAAVTEKGFTLSYISKDGEEGYPGNLQVSVTYSLEDGALSLTYHAVSDKDTICNLSNHAYFNLAGHASGSVGEQKIQVFSKEYTPLGTTGAPDGRIEPVAGTPLDLNEPIRFQAHWDDDFPQIRQARGYDHNYLIDGDGMRPFAKAVCEKNGISLLVESDMPAMQLYTGNYLENLPAGKEKAVYDIRSGFCVETQYPPNAVNCPAFQKPVLLAGEPYKHITVYRFGIEER